MKNGYQIIHMTENEVLEHPFINDAGNACFYRFIAEQFVPYDQIESIDCRKVNVARNIQETWFTYAKEHGIENYELAMLLACNGPKALEQLDDNCVELEEGAIVWAI